MLDADDTAKKHQIQHVSSVKSLEGILSLVRHHHLAVVGAKHQHHDAECEESYGDTGTELVVPPPLFTFVATR